MRGDGGSITDFLTAWIRTSRFRAVTRPAKWSRAGQIRAVTYEGLVNVVDDEATGEITFDGPMTKDQAGARKAVREKAIDSLRRYFEVEAALKKDPANRELKREFKELKKYHDFLEQDFERNARHQALRVNEEGTVDITY
jgi:hypothetical protein